MILRHGKGPCPLCAKFSHAFFQQLRERRRAGNRNRRYGYALSKRHAVRQYHPQPHSAERTCPIAHDHAFQQGCCTMLVQKTQKQRCGVQPRPLHAVFCFLRYAAPVP